LRRSGADNLSKMVRTPWRFTGRVISLFVIFED
jgi:hypothetical protein